ncbi:hypothetical protein MCHI_003790 [Candidatus Magnetoovum chiemensis]|nr:hypothetical protein MCHI_003790 [Candidatus Magnetoovum chiemensis]
MEVTLPIEMYEAFEDALGKDNAKIVVKSLEAAMSNITDYKWKTTKDELLNDIRKEFATKGDLQIVKEEINTLRTEMLGEFKALRTDTAGEFKALRTEMLGEFKTLRAEIDAKIAVANREIIKWMFLFWIGQITVLIAIIKFFIIK